MATLKLDSIAVDCPEPVELAKFYADFLGVENRGDFFYLPGGLVEVWFQQVEDYQAPTWPTQERGQQVHFDISVPDIEASIERAVQLGAPLTDRRNDYHNPILLDPVGHPFCLIAGSESVAATISSYAFDCADPSALATFYQGLIGGEIDDQPGWVELNRQGDMGLAFQQVEGYQPPTWPTQVRGQQIHLDFHTSDRQEHVHRAAELGAERLEVNKGFTVMLDPAGHPFCICDAQE